MNKSAKIVFVAIIAAVLVSPGISSAQTVSSQSIAGLEAEIQALLQQVQQLQAQLAAQQGGGTAWCHTFKTNLGVGSSGSEVAALQIALEKSGFATSDPSGTYGESTAAAATGLQERYRAEVLTPLGLASGTGYTGPSTRKELNALYGCGEMNSTSAATSTAATSTISSSTQPNFCEYAAPPPGCSWEGMQSYPTCGGKIVCQNATSSQPWAWASPTTLSFTAVAGSQSPNPKTITVTGGNDVTWSAKASSAGGWLAASIGTYTGDGIVMVDASTVNLSAGTYHGTVTISGNFQTSPIVIPVTFTVTGGSVQQSSADVSLTPSVFNFSIAQGQTSGYPSGDATFSVDPNQSVNWVWSTSPSGPNSWVSAGTQSFTSESGATLGVTLGTAAANLSAGTYTGTITISPASGASVTFSPQTITVNLTVAPSSQVPTASISADPTTITQGQQTIIGWSSTYATSCTPSNAFGTGSLGSSGSLPEVPSSAGTYTYTVTCTGPGGTSQPASVTVTVSPQQQQSSPTISFSSPSVDSGGTVTMSWSGTKTNDDLIIGFAGCPSQYVTIYDVGSGQSFPCGDAQRYVASSGSYALKFTNTNTTPVAATAQLSYDQGTSAIIEAWANLTINPAPSSPGTVSVETRPLGTQSGRMKTAVDSIGTLTAIPSSTSQMALSNLTVTLDSNVTTTNNFLNSVQLMDASNDNVVSVDSATILSKSCTTSNVCTVTWNFGSDGFLLSGPYTFTLRVDDTQLPPLAGTETLDAHLGGFSYASYSTPSQITTLPSDVLINSISFLPGT